MQHGVRLLLPALVLSVAGCGKSDGPRSLKTAKAQSRYRQTRAGQQRPSTWSSRTAHTSAPTTPSPAMSPVPMALRVPGHGEISTASLGKSRMNSAPFSSIVPDDQGCGRHGHRRISDDDGSRQSGGGSRCHARARYRLPTGDARRVRRRERKSRVQVDDPQSRQARSRSEGRRKMVPPARVQVTIDRDTCSDLESRW